MSDIFISYKREEQPVARRLADTLEKKGWSVWWDPKLRAGERVDDVIEKALIDAKCVIVMWSKLSVKSNYVKDEARYSLDHDKLVPITIEEVELPFRFKGIQTRQLYNRDGSDSFTEFQKLVADIESIIGSPPAGPTTSEADKHEIKSEDGVRQRLSVSSPFGYWPRLMVTDADRPEDQCSPEFYRTPRILTIPDEVLRELLDEEHRRNVPQPTGTQSTPAAEGLLPQPSREPFSRTALATRLKYVFLAERARAESIVHQRQPGLIETLVQNAIHVDSFNPDLARTLFQLMVPLEFRATVRDTERLVLMLDAYTANLPWEMLQADEKPMVLKTRVVRQLVSSRFRKTVHLSTSKAACVIADPSTEGFQEAFLRGHPLPQLPGAEKESHTIRDLLTKCNYEVEFVPPESRALDVMSRLLKRPYRILHIAAHGEFDIEAADGSRRSGVLLSDGLMLTAAEIHQMEVVPDLVFLNCCHRGKIDAMIAYNRLAYSLARELIEMGVCCVVAAGWWVNDQAALTFAQTFFSAFVENGQPFGDAIHEARKETFNVHPGCNTWGAYQAYGDPGFVFEPGW